MPDLALDPPALELMALGVAQDACAVPRSAGEPPRLAATARALLLEAAPGASILGAKTAAAAPPTRHVWIVESLTDDGSRGVALAATVDGEVVAAAVVDLEMGVTYSAHRGGGARQDDQRVRPASADRLDGAAIAEGDDVPAVMLCQVARGSLDGCVHLGPVSPSALAGAHIAEEAGALVELPCPENADLLLAAAPRLFEALRARHLACERSH